MTGIFPAFDSTPLLRARAAFALLLASLIAVLASAIALPAPALADSADINAAARGVVRVVIIGHDGDDLYVISHGTGFAIEAETIVTNAHVVAGAIEDDRLSIGIVPSDGGSAVFGRLSSVSKRNDLALIRTTTPMRLPPLTIAGNAPRNSGSVTAVGYPMNVDRAQGLEMEDFFLAQPPVTSTGFLSGSRPSREFDTLLHTAPIARGNSGGPLVDNCGRVIGVNSFGAESGGTDAEFFFAVSTRELLPFLRANSITPRVNGLPCRSLADLDAEERVREEARRDAAEEQADAAEEVIARQREEARRDIQFEVLAERENRLAIALLLLVAAMGCAGFAYMMHDKDAEKPRNIAIAVGLIALAATLFTWLSRPGFDGIETRLEDRLREQMTADEGDGEDGGTITQLSADSTFLCTLDETRSRVVGAISQTVPIDWDEGGCVNARTQYGTDGGNWTRVFVPNSEAAVSVNRFDPAKGEFVIDRYLLGNNAMTEARAARADYDAPSCVDGADEEAAKELGRKQAGILALLPNRPNERLVYNCSTSAKE